MEDLQESSVTTETTEAVVEPDKVKIESVPASSAKDQNAIFNGIRFCLCDDVKDIDEIKRILIDGGGKLVNYLSDVVTHLIAENADHPVVTQAVEIFEKPVVTTKWVRMSLESKTLLPVGAFNPSKNQIFSGVTVTVSKLDCDDVISIWAMLTHYGGNLKLQLDNSCTHLITNKPEGIKYEKAKDLVKIVTSDWVVDCIKNKQRCDEEIYHPKLLVTFCTRPRPQPLVAEPVRPSTVVASSQSGLKNSMPQNQASRQVRIFSQAPVRVVQIPKSVQRPPFQSAPLTTPQAQQGGLDSQNQNWSNQQQPQPQMHQQQQSITRPPNTLLRAEGHPQQIQMSPRNQVFLSLQQQPQVRPQPLQHQQQLNFVQVRHVQQQPQHQQAYPPMQSHNQQPSQKPPNVILQQRIQPPVHTLSLAQQQQQQLQQQQQQQQQHHQQQQIQQSVMPQQNLIIQSNQHPNQMTQMPGSNIQIQYQQPHQQQQMIAMQRHPEMVHRQNYIQRPGFVGQPRVARVPQMRMSQITGPSPQVRGPSPMGPQPMMNTQFGPDHQRMNMRQPMEMQNQNVMMRHPMQQQAITTNQSWNEMPMQVVRTQQMQNSGQNFPPQNYNQMMWPSQPNTMAQQVAVPPSPATPNEPPRTPKGNSPRSGEKRNQANSTSPKSTGTLSSVSSASVTYSTGSPSTNCAIVTSKTKTALANLLNTRLQNSGPITSSSSSTCSNRNYHDPSVTYPSGSASNCTSSSSSSTSTPTSLTAPPLSLPTAPPTPSNDGTPALISSCCPLSPSNRLVCIGSPGVILPTGDILHRGLLEAQPIQERFVGHDQSLSIPSDLCLIGCTFFITGYDVEKYSCCSEFLLSPKQKELLVSRIRRCGGQVETVYSAAKVTHVLTDIQDSPVVEQAIRDGKRLVTIYWLDAIIKSENKLRPPWRVIHIPRSPKYLPAKSEMVASSGFSIEERKLIREVCLQIGAKYTPHFSTKNTVLICKKLDGEKYTKAVEWCIPVVNMQWLNDVALGVNDAMRQPYGTNMKHKTFDLKDPFDLVDTPSIRNIMVGWTTPIRVTEEELNKAIEDKKNEVISQSSVSENEPEKMNKESDDDVFAKPPAKKIKVSENVSPDVVKKSDESTLPPPPPLTLAPFATVPFKIMITGTEDKKEKMRLEAIVKRLGAKCTTKFAECTHLLAEQPVRTVKFLCALNYATYVISKSWLTQSDLNNSFISENGHELQDVKPALARRKDLNGKALLDKKVVYITPGCIPSPSVLSDIAQCAGGIPVTSRGPTSNQMDRMKESGLEFIIVTKKETDLHLIEKYLERNVPCLNPEWLISSVMAQKLCSYNDFQITSD